MIWEHLPDDDSRDAVLVAERFADGLADAKELARAGQLIRKRNQSGGLNVGQRVSYEMASATTMSQPYSAALFMTATVSLAGYRGEIRAAEATLCDLIRCVFDNPFRPPTVERECRRWNGGAAVALARKMYDERDFSAAPMLADMLEDAGCTDAHVLTHLRGPGPHVRGCIALEQLLMAP